MKKLLTFGGRREPRRKDSRRPLIENNNNNDDIQNGNDQAVNGYNNPFAQNTFNTHEERRLQSEEEVTPQALAELLGVPSDVDLSEGGSCCSNSTQKNLRAVCLITKYVSQHFPKAPADLNQNLQRHLLGVQETVRNDLERLGPLLDSMGLMGCLIDCYHHQTFDHLNDLLQNISSSLDLFVLMKWVLHTYLSQELLGHTELQEVDPVKEADLLLFTEWVEKAKNKLLENVQKDIREYLEKILQNERSKKGCDHDEAYVRLYVDTVQCIDAPIKEAQKISSKLSDEVREVCFQELLLFLRRYTAEQKEILGNTAKMDKPETILFLKTLNTCKELKQHIQTRGKGLQGSLLQETVATLEEMEAFTLKLLMETAADIAESHLKYYFKTENKQFFFLILAVKTYFPKLLWCQDVHKSVMDEAYKLIVHIYLKHLIRSSQSKLRKCWSPNVGETVTEDAKLLHNTISELAPGVKQWNLLLLKINELMECECADSMKLTVASMQKECLTWSEDLELLPALLRWTGLSGGEVREVLDAIPGHQPRRRPWYSCLTCW